MKTILITGANGFLGTATVKKFLDSGYRVLALDHHDQHLAFAAGHPQFSFYATDLGDEKGVEQLVHSLIGQFGTLEGALMIAGGFAMGSIADTPASEINKQIHLNFETAYQLTRPLLSHMQQKGYGRLVFIGARPALLPAQGKDLVAYALSKSLLFRLAELINEQNKGTNVVASVLAPSTLDTPANRAAMPHANPEDWVSPGQVAEVLEFICSEKGRSIREPVYKLYNNS